MRRVALTVLLTTLPELTLAASPKVFLFDVLHRPVYRASYNQMLRGARNLPTWMATADEATHSTDAPGELMEIGGEEIELFDGCKPHDCGSESLVVIFKDFGQTAKAVLSTSGEKRFFGHPTAAEIKLLASKLAD